MSRHAPNRAARSLVTRRTETGALIVSGEERNAFTARVPADPFFGRVVTGVVDCLRPRSTHPLLMFADSAQTRQQALNELRQRSADGALVVSTHADDPLPALLADAGLPAVFLARPSRPVPLSYVDLAHRDGARIGGTPGPARPGGRGDRHWTGQQDRGTGGVGEPATERQAHDRQDHRGRGRIP
jgi:DNA-binding LacI/PurR family transcriptional regulator